MRVTLWVLAVASGLALVACKPEKGPRGPRASHAEGVAPGTSWTLWDGPDPYLVYSEEGHRKMSFGCPGVSWEASAHWFEAAQAWPQPKLSFGFGEEIVTGVPDANVQEKGVGLRIRKRGSDRIHTAMDRAEDVLVTFHGQEQRIALPQRTIDAFLGLCRMKTPPGMR